MRKVPILSQAWATASLFLTLLPMLAPLTWAADSEDSAPAKFENLLISNCEQAQNDLNSLAPDRRQATFDYLLVLVSQPPFQQQVAPVVELLAPRPEQAGAPMANLVPTLSHADEIKRRSCALQIIEKSSTDPAATLLKLLPILSTGTPALFEQRLQDQATLVALKLAALVRQTNGAELNRSAAELVSWLTTQDKIFYTQLALLELGPAALPALFKAVPATPATIQPTLLRTSDDIASMSSLAEPTLLDLINSDQNSLRHLGLRRLRCLAAPSNELWQNLVKMLAHSDANTRVSATKTASSFVASGSLPTLMLERSDTAIFVDALLATQPDRREAMTEIAVALSQHLPGFKQELDTRYHTIGRSPTAPYLFYLLGRLYGESSDTYASLIEALTGKDAILHSAALDALALLPSKRNETLRHLIKLFHSGCSAKAPRSEPVSLAISSATAIEKLNFGPAGAPLASCLWDAQLASAAVEQHNNESAIKHGAAAQLSAALISLGSGAESVILKDSASSDPLARRLAVHHLAALHSTSPRVAQKLVERIGDTDPAIRSTAIAGLAQMDTVPQSDLLKLLGDTKEDTRRAALAVLLGHPISQTKIVKTISAALKTTSCSAMHALVTEVLAPLPPLRDLFYERVYACADSEPLNEEWLEFLAKSGPLPKEASTKLLNATVSIKGNSPQQLAVFSRASALGIAPDQQIKGLFEIVQGADLPLTLRALRMIAALPADGNSCKQGESLLEDTEHAKAEVRALVFGICATIGQDAERFASEIQQLLIDDQDAGLRVVRTLPTTVSLAALHQQLNSTKEETLIAGLRAVRILGNANKEIEADLRQRAHDARPQVRIESARALAVVIPNADDTAAALREVFLSPPPSNVEALSWPASTLAAMENLAAKDQSLAVRSLARSVACSLRQSAGTESAPCCARPQELLMQKTH